MGGKVRSPRNGPGQGAAIRRRLAGKGDFLAVAIYLAVLGMVGGGLIAWSLSYMLLAPATIVFAVWMAWRDGFRSLSVVPLAGRLALAGVAILPLLQLVPLPPSVWQGLPGQELRRATLMLTGVADRWQAMSLEPVGTALCAVLALGFVALVGALLRLSDEDYRRVLVLAFALVLLGILAGLLQVVSDGQFPQLQADNMGATMLGFYANKNHMGLVIASSILLFGFVVSRDALTRDRRRAAVIGYIVVALVCIVTTNSRAGLALGLLASAITVMDLARGVALRYRIAVLAAIAVLAVAVMSSSAFEVVSSRVEDASSDLRWRIASWSWPLAERYWALGSGIGSFRTLFTTAEQLAWVKPTIVNAAHDDYLQLLIEAGVPGVVLLTLLILSLLPSMARYRSLSPRDPQRGVVVFGAGVLLLFTIHSAVDYPLRRPAAWAFFALALTAVYRGTSGRDRPMIGARAAN
jgi:O-antigen ligase